MGKVLLDRFCSWINQVSTEWLPHNKPASEIQQSFSGPVCSFSTILKSLANNLDHSVALMPILNCSYPTWITAKVIFLIASKMGVLIMRARKFWNHSNKCEAKNPQMLFYYLAYVLIIICWDLVFTFFSLRSAVIYYYCFVE